MAHEEPTTPRGPAKLVIESIGLMLSGDIGNPILDADAIVAAVHRLRNGQQPVAPDASLSIAAIGFTTDSSPKVIAAHSSAICRAGRSGSHASRP